MDPNKIDLMKAAQEAFAKLSPDQRLLFNGWCRQQSMNDLMTSGNEAREKFVNEMKSGLNETAEKAGELGDKASNLLEKGGNYLDKTMRKFLGNEKV